MSPHPSLSDWSDEQRFSELVATHRSGFVAGTQPAPAEACTELGADEIRAESEREEPGYWWAMPVTAILSILAAWWQFGAPL